VKAGAIDPQIVSFDAYLKFIEDLFLRSERIGGRAGLRPDSRPVVRESLTSITQPTGMGFTGNPVPVGDLLNDFNFSQTPLNPLILPTNIPNNFKGTLKTNTSYAFPLTWQPPANVSVAGYTVYRTTTSGSNYKPVPGCSAAFASPSPAPAAPTRRRSRASPTSMSPPAPSRTAPKASAPGRSTSRHRRLGSESSSDFTMRESG
jgi:hypothetical protein